MTENITDEKLAKMLAKVQGLLAVAEDSATLPAAAENYRAQAQAIMTKYRIEEEELRQTKIASGTAAKPVTVTFGFMRGHSPYLNHYYSMILSVMNHVGVRGQWKSTREANEETGRMESVYNMVMVGFDSDIQVAQMLYTNLRLTFSEKLEPKVDRSLSDLENVYRLRSAGIERGRIGEMMGWGDNAHIKVTNVYKKACAARGEDPKVVGRSLNVKTFRTSFADAFLSETQSRLWRMRTGAGDSGALVLVGREEAVNEAFYEEFPDLRPAAAIDTPRRSVKEQCPKCQKSKRGACRDHYVATGSYKPRPHSSTGWTAGTMAAREADLSRGGSDPMGRLEA